MWAFQYKHGDRPLEGYTIQRAAGRGGFGEVYYAISDSGREVALKVVQGYEQIELRGITQCMNLKSQHLVAIFDVKFNEQGKPFVIMEFVSGPNLRQLLDENPAGLGSAKAAFFLREIAKGLQYLHDCGIVHRDLKPGNIFFENGIVKIGDYGLSKSISTSQHSAQTVTVGTVHYMAPEIGAGKYDRSIDIYALGAVLYEMLTGVPPFVGASPTEVLMKHLQAEPDMSSIEEPFRSAIKRAMAKDPAQRFKSVQEMVEAVFGAEHVQMSVSQFSPQELSMVAGRVAAKITAGGSPGSFSPSTGALHPPRPPRALLDSSAQPCDDEDELDERIALAGWTEQAADPLPLGARIVLASVCWLAISIGVGLFMNHPAPAFIVAFSSAGAAASLLVFGRWLGRHVKDETQWVQRLTIAGPAAVFVNLAALPVWFSDPSVSAFARQTILIISASMLLADSRTWLSPTRRTRAAIGPAFGAALVAFVLCMIFNGSAKIAIGTIAATSIMVQLIAPWRRESERVLQAEKYAAGGLGIKTTIQGRQPAVVNRVSAVNAVVPPPIPAPPPLPRGPAFTASVYRTVPRYAPMLWLAAFITLVAIGIPLCVIAGEQPYIKVSQPYYSEGGVRYVTSWVMSGEAIAVTVAGVIALIGGAACLLQSFKKRFRGWWPYVIRPAIRFLCVAIIVACGVILANANLSAAATAVLISKIVLCSLTFVFLTFVPARWWDPRARAITPAAVPTTITPEPGVSPRKRLWALILAGVGLVTPVAGLHRLYVGKIGTGILYLITWGWFGIGSLIDVIMIACGGFADMERRKLLRWEDEPLPGETLAQAARAAAPATPRWVDRVVSSVESAIDSTSIRIGSVRLDARDRRRARATARLAAFQASQAARTARGGVISALAGLFLFCATIVAIALAVDVPGMIDADRPDPRVKAEVIKFLDGADLLSHRPAAPALGTKILVNRVGGEIVIGNQPQSFTGVVDRFAENLQQQFHNFDQELAQAIIRTSRDVARGDLDVSRTKLEIAALTKSISAAQDALRKLEETRKALADIEQQQQGKNSAVAAVPQPPQPPKVQATRSWKVNPSVGIELGERSLSRAMNTLPPIEFEDDVSVAAPLRLAGMVAWGILTLTGVSLLMFARRRNGAFHLVRGVAGVATLMLAMIPLNSAVGARQIWADTQGASVKLVAEEMTRALSSPTAVLAGVVFLLAMLMLSWPPRRTPQVLAAAMPVSPPAPAAPPPPAPVDVPAEGVRS